MSPRPLEPGAIVSYELTGNRGAALLTRYPTYCEDSLERSGFEKYTKRHYKSWVKFARDKQYGDNIHPILVSGFDMTRDFDMVAYSQESTSLEAGLTIAVPTLVAASPSLWGTRQTRCSPHTNRGPRTYNPLTRDLAPGFLSSGGAEISGIPDGFNQCVFIRYCTMRSRMPIGMFSEVIWAGAMPLRDLGSGKNRGVTFSGLAVQVNDELITYDEEDPGAQLTPVMDNAGAETDVVARNTPFVWHLLSTKSPL